MVRAGIIAESVSPGLATVLKAIGHRKGRVRLYASEKIIGASSDHQNTWPFVARDPVIEVRSYEQMASLSHQDLFITWCHRLHYPSHAASLLPACVRQADRATLLYDTQFGSWRQMMTQQVRFVARHWNWLRKVGLICYTTIFPDHDLFRWLRYVRVPLSVGPNIHYLFTEADRKMLYQPWDGERTRELAILCTGTRGICREREHLLRDLEAGLAKNSGVALMRHRGASGESRGAGQKVVWALDEYRPAIPEYLEWLRDSEFCLCIPGTSWTHRPFEALVCGSVPILDRVNARFHDIPWEDGKNCILTGEPWDIPAWRKAVDRALGCPTAKRLEMRQNIQVLRARHLCFESFLNRMADRLGLDRPHEN